MSDSGGIRALGGLACGAVIGWMISLALIVFASLVVPSALIFGGGFRSAVVVGLATAFIGIVTSLVASRRGFQRKVHVIGWGIAGYGFALIVWVASTSHIGW